MHSRVQLFNISPSTKNSPFSPSTSINNVISQKEFDKKRSEAFSDLTGQSDEIDLSKTAQENPNPEYYCGPELFPFQKYALAWLLNREKIKKINFDSCASTSVRKPVVEEKNYANAKSLPLRRQRQDDSVNKNKQNESDSDVSTQISDDDDSTEIETSHMSGDDEEQDPDAVLTQIKSDSSDAETECDDDDDDDDDCKNKNKKRKNRGQDDEDEKSKIVATSSFTRDNSRFFWRRIPPIRPGDAVCFIHDLTNEKTYDNPILPRGGILADEMGLGKSVSTTALLSHDLEFAPLKNINTNNNSNNYSSYQYVNQATLKTLIVVPASLIENWRMHCTQYLKASKYQVYVVHGSGDKFAELRAAFRRQDRDEDLVQKRTIAITTYQTLSNEFTKHFPHLAKQHKDQSARNNNNDDDDAVDDDKKKRTIRSTKNNSTANTIALNNNNNANSSYSSVFYETFWARIILDEAHAVKSESSLQTKACQELRAEVRWAVTGTPIANRISELQSLLKFLKFSVFENKSIWDDMIAKPLKDRNMIGVSRLAHIIQRVCLRRTKADTFAGKKLLDLPKMHILIQNIELDPEERRNYENVKAKMSVELEKLYEKSRVPVFSSASGKKVQSFAFIKSLVLLTKLRQFATDYRLVKDIEKYFENSSESEIKNMFQGISGDVENENGGISQRLLDILLEKIDGTSAQQTTPSTTMTEKERRAIEQRKNQQNQKHDDDDDDNKSIVSTKSSEKINFEGIEHLRLMMEMSCNQRGDEESDDDEDDDDDVCAICLEKPELRNAAILTCRHVFCSDCVSDWMKSKATCPCCNASARIILKYSDLAIYDEKISQHQQKNQEMKLASAGNKQKQEDLVSSKPGAKCVAVYKYVKENILDTITKPQLPAIQKCVIFSLWPRMFHLILQYFDFQHRLGNPSLQNHGIGYRILTGSDAVVDRNKSVLDFQTDPKVRVIFVSTMAGGVGLTLTKAQHCIVIDPFWNPAIDKQAIMRVHRISQTNPVTVVRFFAGNTVDQKILRLQIKKQKLINLSIDSGRKISSEDKEMMEKLIEAAGSDEQDDDNDDDEEEVEILDEEGNVNILKRKKIKATNNKFPATGSDAGGLNLAELRYLFN